MTAFDSAYLLDMFNRKAGRPASDAVTDASKYARLSESQHKIVAKIAAVAPKSLYPKVGYGSIPTLTSVDGQVFTFGNDANGYPLFPMGQGGVFPSLAAIPSSPWVEGVDYLNEGTQIRIPNNGTFSGTLYWYGVQDTGELNATGGEPSLFPEASRELIVIDAVRQFAVEYARQPDLAQLMAAEWASAWPEWCLAWKTQFKSGGAIQPVVSTSASGSGASSGGGSTGGTGGGTTPAANDGYFNSDYWG